MIALMLFMFFFFLGIVAMFWHLSRALAMHCKALRDEHAQLRVLLRAMESRLDHLSSAARADAISQAGLASPGAGEAGRTDASGGGSPGCDPLLHLSFEEPPRLEEKPLDPALELNFSCPGDFPEKRP